MTSEGAFFKAGTPIEVAAHVLTYRDTGLLFPNDLKRRRTSCVCLHWTGSENAPSDVYRNMCARKVGGKPAPVSVHFVVDQAGMVYQMADADAFLSHAPGINDRSVGIEIVSPGDAANVPTKGVKRELVTDTIHGKPCTYRAFLPAQVASVLALCDALCREYELPMRVPMRGENVRADVLNAKELLTYRGVLGHYHTKATKRDPGVRLLRAVQARGQARARPHIG